MGTNGDITTDLQNGGTTVNIGNGTSGINAGTGAVTLTSDAGEAFSAAPRGSADAITAGTPASPPGRWTWKPPIPSAARPLIRQMAPAIFDNRESTTLGTSTAEGNFTAVAGDLTIATGNHHRGRRQQHRPGADRSFHQRWRRGASATAGRRRVPDLFQRSGERYIRRPGQQQPGDMEHHLARPRSARPATAMSFAPTRPKLP